MKIRIMEPMQEVKQKKKRVCAYARVSTDNQKQEESLENQTASYERLIRGNPEYEFAGVYADQGISGYCESRPQFQKMLDAARAGKLDLIITKSISRFARNTVTVLKFARELKELGVGIFFEEQNINTLSGDGEMMLAVLASFAQEESRSASENNKWSIRKKFERGEAQVNTARFLGYGKAENGGLAINQKEAAVVRLVFGLTVQGVGSSRIANLLNSLGAETVMGGDWHDGTIRQMVSNEKYKGDCHLQKTYTPPGKRGKTIKNDGAVQSYYVEDNHPAIVSRELWEQAQEEVKGRYRRNDRGQKRTKDPLSGMLVCPLCGKNLRRHTEYKGTITWVCGTRMDKGVAKCKGIRVADEQVKKRGITEPTVVEEVERNGKKYYCYTSKAEWDRGGRTEGRGSETEDGGILQGINRPRRTVIKL